MSRDYSRQWWEAVNEGGDPARFTCRSEWHALSALGGALARLWGKGPAAYVDLLERRGERADGPQDALRRAGDVVAVRFGSFEESFSAAEFETLAAEFGVMIFDELAALDTGDDALWALLPRLQALRKRGQDAGGPKALPATRYDPHLLVPAPGGRAPGLGLLAEEVGEWWRRDADAFVSFLEKRGALAREHAAMRYPLEPWEQGVVVSRGPHPSDYVTVRVPDFEALAPLFALRDEGRPDLRKRLEALRERGLAAGGTRVRPEAV